MQESIDFLICNYNGGALLKKCIDSVLNLNLTNININVYIYDNASADDSLDSIKTYKLNQITIVEGKDNIGYGNAINKLFDISKSKYILILNPDAELEFDNVEIEDLINKSDDKIIFGFNILNLDGTSQNFLAAEPNYKWIVGGLLRIGFPGIIEPVYKKYFSTSISKTSVNNSDNCVEFVSGCALLMKRTSFLQIGKFNKEYFLYFEDTELLHTAKKEGFCIKKSKLKIRHNASYSFRNSSHLIKVEKYRSALIYFNNTRGYLYSLWIKICIISIAILSLLNPINIFKRKLGMYFMNLIFICVKN
jgi:GT2 family glycosyltransferase